MTNICRSCGRNDGKYPKVTCMREPYDDEICKAKCEYWISVEEYAAALLIYRAALADQQLTKRRKARVEKRRLRWAKFKQPDNLCRTCANNLEKFPLVQCKRQPFHEEENYQEECDDYHKITPGELLLFIKFPCGTVRELDWKPNDYKGPFGFIRCDGNRAIKASLVGTAPLDKKMVFAAYKFLDYSMNPTNRKIFMNAAVDAVLGAYV